MAIVDIIKYNGNPDVFAWKYPNEEIGTWSQLIVNESQEAVIFKGGKALDVFQSGRHTLETANIPLLSRIINIPFGGKSPFIAEIWYVNKISSLDIKWGTATPIQLQDPKYGVFLPLRSHGQFGIRIVDSSRFLTSLVGTLPAFDKENLIRYFRGMYLTKVKDTISSYLVKKHISVLEINAFLEEMSDESKEKMIPVLAEYGIELVNFYVNDVSVPEEDPAVIQLKNALAKKAEMNIIGYNYQQERSFDTLEGAATNTGSTQSGLLGAGLGLGMGVGMGSYVGSEFGDIVKQNIATKGTYTCTKCKAVFSMEYKFCPECGNQHKPLPINSEVKTEYCPNCKNELPDRNLKFCPECGYALARKCPNCNSDVDKNQKFCIECGEKL